MHELRIDELRRDSESWWDTSRRKLLREAVTQAVHGKREARVLDLGCTAQLEFENRRSTVRVMRMAR